ncbi:MAG: hypothetical protein OXG82_05640 [Gammaproteobacteria bacterium]|nr:hypothetical protein [Gammaproteobacteria bacterium]
MPPMPFDPRSLGLDQRPDPAASLGLLLVESPVPGADVDALLLLVPRGIDFHDTLMHGMLSVLLFAGPCTSTFSLASAVPRNRPHGLRRHSGLHARHRRGCVASSTPTPMSN